MGSSGFDATVPSVLAGDFNLHAPLWSLPGAMLSGGHDRFTMWLDDEGWSLANPPHIPTWRGTGQCASHAPSVLNLVFLNDAALFHDVVSPVSISFSDSITLDHAALTFCLSFTPAPLPPAVIKGFKINDALKANWITGFCRRPQHLPPTSIPKIDRAAQSLLDDIDAISAALFDRRHAPDPCGAPWWDESCNIALTSVTLADTDNAPLANAVFRVTICAAKRAYYDRCLVSGDPADLWLAVRGRKGCSNHVIPAIHGPPRYGKRLP